HRLPSEHRYSGRSRRARRHGVSAHRPEHADVDSRALRRWRSARSAHASGDHRGRRCDDGRHRRGEVHQVAWRRGNAQHRRHRRIHGVKIEWRTVGPFQENSYLVVDETTGRAVLIDPGAEPEALLAMLETSGATLEAIWLTHAHIDHIGGIAAVKRIIDVPVYLHPADRPLYDRGAVQAGFYGLPFEQPPTPERALAEDDRLELGNLVFQVMHLPGHAPGHVAFVSGDRVLSGDLLFAGSV